MNAKRREVNTRALLQLSRHKISARLPAEGGVAGRKVLGEGDQLAHRSDGVERRRGVHDLPRHRHRRPQLARVRAKVLERVQNSPAVSNPAACAVDNRAWRATSQRTVRAPTPRPQAVTACPCDFCSREESGSTPFKLIVSC